MSDPGLEIVRDIDIFQPPPEAPETTPLTDLGNAEQFARRHGVDLRYCPARGWLVWDGRRWQRDDVGEVTQRMADTIRAMQFDALTLGDDGARRALVKHALASEREARIRAAVTLAATVPELVLRPTKLDADPNLLNVENGTLHLPSGELRPHDRANLLTMLVPVEYDPDAEAPIWAHFLQRATKRRAELADFLQRAAGYTLAGQPREHVALILYGWGANGKTTLIETLRALFGDYGQQTPASTFLDRREGIPSDVARLDGARFVSAVEMPDGRRLNETLVKRLTGGDTITARYLHREWFEFRPRFVPWIATNHKPTVRGTDEAIWRRIRLVPFDVEIPAAERDRDLPDKLRAELSGILRWAVEGHAAYLRRGLEAPAEVVTATEGYRHEQDVIGRFLEECCEFGDGLRERPSDLQRAFADYAGRDERITSRTFSEELRRRGFDQSRTGQARFWLGVALLDERDGDAN